MAVLVRFSLALLAVAVTSGVVAGSKALAAPKLTHWVLVASDSKKERFVSPNDSLHGANHNPLGSSDRLNTTASLVVRQKGEPPPADTAIEPNVGTNIIWQTEPADPASYTLPWFAFQASFPSPPVAIPQGKSHSFSVTVDGEITNDGSGSIGAGFDGIPILLRDDLWVGGAPLRAQLRCVKTHPPTCDPSAGAVAVQATTAPPWTVGFPAIGSAKDRFSFGVSLLNCSACYTRFTYRPASRKQAQKVAQRIRDATPVVKTVKAPAPGKTRTVAQPVRKKSKEMAAGITGDDLFAGVAAVERERLKKRKKKLESLCYSAVAVAVKQDIASSAVVNPFFTISPFAARTAKTCAEILELVQKRIDELGGDRGTQAIAQGEPACRVFRFRLRAEKKGGKWFTRVVKKGVEPRLKVTCKATDGGLRLNLRARGKRTLRQAVGTKVKLTVRRPDSAPAPVPGSRLTVSFAQK